MNYISTSVCLDIPVNYLVYPLIKLNIHLSTSVCLHIPVYYVAYPLIKLKRVSYRHYFGVGMAFYIWGLYIFWTVDIALCSSYHVLLVNIPKMATKTTLLKDPADQEAGSLSEDINQHDKVMADPVETRASSLWQCDASSSSATQGV